MLFQGNVKVADVESYEGQKGFGFNATVTQKQGKKTKTLDFRGTSRELFGKLEDLLDTEVSIIIDLDQNSYGLRLGDVQKIFSADGKSELYSLTL